jgi:DNA helicase-2/ATP-dependent DNA helicase PcrA
MLNQLNTKQKEAVLSTDGPLLIVAGAGSGKTKVLTTRIKYLLTEKHVSPESILAVTFTNKAAREMESRIGARLPWIGTFHGICGRFLRRHIQHLTGYTSSYVIFDDQDQTRLIKSILKERCIENKMYTPQKVLGCIGKAKNQMISPEAYATSAHDVFHETIAKIYSIYQKTLQKNNAVDFDDMLLLTIRILEEQPAILEQYQHKFKYILVDEYQDTNKAQYLMLTLLARGHRNICVVGDSDQSIYSWRGADITNILSFESDFPDAKTILLEQNYRSTQNILSAANAIIKNNTIRKEKNLWTDNTAGDLIQFRFAASEKAEVSTVLETIDKLRGDFHSLNNFAVFYRTNAQSRVFEEGLINRGIKYRLVGGTKFYQRKEIKDILSYLRVICNPQDELALERIINLPTRGIGDMTIARYKVFAESTGRGLFDVLGEKIDGLGERAQSLVGQFKQMMIGFQATQTMPLSELINTVIHVSGYHGMLLGSTDEADLDRMDNIFELVTMAKEKEGQLDLPAFLEHISLLSDADNQEEQDAVTLMTIHSAKGLEFPVVFITGMEEGLMPHFRTLYNPIELEEERRLCYVAVTRAEQKLFLSAAKVRTQAGETRYSEKSRFIDEIPSELIESEEEQTSIFTSRLLTDDTSSAMQPIKVLKPIQDFKAGEEVFHNKWGRGRILKVFGSGEDLTLDIQFTRVRKTILAQYAVLEKVS